MKRGRVRLWVPAAGLALSAMAMLDPLSGAQGRTADPQAAQRKERAKAVREAAESGDVKAEVLLGTMAAAGGWGVRHSYKDAAKWWQAAADQGSTRAEYLLGELYLNGKGVDQDDDQALKLFRHAAGKNEAGAEEALGRLYLYGTVVTQDVRQALAYFNKAVAQDYPPAYTDLGLMEISGNGVSKDAKAGVAHLRTAAEEGDGWGQYFLALSLNDGVGTARDAKEALKWVLVAEAHGIKKARKLEEQLSGELSTAEVDRIQAEADGWKPRKGGDEASNAAPSLSGGDDSGDSASAHSGKGKGGGRVVATGTGFFINAAGQVLTNHHVIGECGGLAAGTVAGGMSPAELVADDSDNDLAVIKVAAAPKAVASFRAPVLRQAEAVMAYGFPLTGALASDGNVTSGNVTALAGWRDDPRYFQISAPVQPGNSGGPLLDMSGNVAGVIVAKLDALRIAKVIHDIPQNVNFAIKGTVATKFLDDHGIRYGSAGSGGTLSPPDVSDKARAFTVLIECLE